MILTILKKDVHETKLIWNGLTQFQLWPFSTFSNIDYGQDIFQLMVRIFFLYEGKQTN